jgi:beta-galactosidase
MILRAVFTFVFLVTSTHAFTNDEIKVAFGSQPSAADGHVSLDGPWEFKTDLYQEGEDKGWHKAEFAANSWETMQVPGNWDLKNEHAEYVGAAWYRRKFDVPVVWNSKGVRLVFEAVYNDAKIWINGQEVGTHHVGFLPFWFDIDPYLNFGGENVVVVKADNTFKRGAIWNWGGIRRPVWLEITEKTRLNHQHITAVPDLAKGTAHISMAFGVLNRQETDARVGYQVVVSRNGEVVWQSGKKYVAQNLVVPKSSSRKFNISFTLPRSLVRLWHVDRPNLYHCTINLYQDGQVIHQLEDRFGIRKIEVDGYNIKLNGEVIRTVGFNWVPEDRTTGSTLPLWRIKGDIDMMKELGANMARLSHLPLPKAVLDYLDEIGMMTFEEVSLWGKDEMADPDHPLPKYWLEKMIQVKYNHPSVIGWTVGNEIGYSSDNPKAMEYVEESIKNTKKLDPERLAVYVSHSVHRQEEDPIKYSDIIMFNIYSDWSKNSETVNQLHPGKPIFMAEYGSQLNHENPDQAHIDAARMLDEMRGKDYLMGASLWTFNDYRSFWRGSPAWTTAPSQNRAWGIVNVFRQKKRPYHLFKKQHAPVQDLKVSLSEGKAEIRLTPRGKMDIPAFTLRDYQIIWHIFDKTGNWVSGGIEELPVINPGDPAMLRNISWKNIPGAHGIKIDLVDPQMYSRRDTTIHFEVPDAPEIIKINTSNNQIRIVFAQPPHATEYKVLYGKGELNMETPPTINDFVDVTGLDQFEEYLFSVVAINCAGPSKPSPVRKASTSTSVLPPVIWKTVPFDDRFFIGYSVEQIDYLYEVQYGTKPGVYDKQAGFRNVGVIQIPGLDPGQTYYYRLRSRKQWGFPSEWTQEVEVNLLSEKQKMQIEPKGAIATKNGWLISFEPQEKAIGYEVFYRETTNDNWKKTFINRAIPHYVMMSGLKKSSYEFKINAIIDLNEYGKINNNGNILLY